MNRKEDRMKGRVKERERAKEATLKSMRERSLSKFRPQFQRVMSAGQLRANTCLLMVDGCMGLRMSCRL
eukprot:1296785-Amorphochlora_amoeboformis.AAC.1